MTITISPEGIVHCLWTDALPLHELGKLEVKRASTIEFDYSSQTWSVKMSEAPDKIVFSNPSRAVCLAWEREYVESHL